MFKPNMRMKQTSSGCTFDAMMKQGGRSRFIARGMKQAAMVSYYYYYYYYVITFTQFKHQFVLKGKEKRRPQIDESNG